MLHNPGLLLNCSTYASLWATAGSYKSGLSWGASDLAHRLSSSTGFQAESAFWSRKHCKSNLRFGVENTSCILFFFFLNGGCILHPIFHCYSLVYKVFSWALSNKTFFYVKEEQEFHLVKIFVMSIGWWTLFWSEMGSMDSYRLHISRYLHVCDFDMRSLYCIN